MIKMTIRQVFVQHPDHPAVKSDSSAKHKGDGQN
jgi:hypothetical protein